MYKVITNNKQLEDAIEILCKAKVLGVDSETTDLDPRVGKLRLLQIADGRFTAVIDCFCFKSLDALQPLLSSDSTKVFHNAKFDLEWLKYHYNLNVDNVYDTFLAEQLLSMGEKKIGGFYKLGSLVSRYLGQYVDKGEQLSDWSRDLSYTQIQYAAKDAEILLPLCKAQVVKLRELDLTQVAKIEFDCVAAIAYTKMCGIFLDAKQWTELAEENEVKLRKVTDELQDEMQEGMPYYSVFDRCEINLSSIEQASECLKRMGIPLPESTLAWELEPLAKEYPLVKKFLEHRKLDTAISSFGKEYLKYIHSQDSRIHPDFMQIEAKTGRMSGRNPNTMQPPADKRYRSCYKAQAGNKIVSCDFSQVELRILAELSQDPVMIQAFVDGEDLHAVTAHNVFKIDMARFKDKEDEEASKKRTYSKRINFGVSYGIGSFKLGIQCEIDKEEAEKMLTAYFKTYKGVKVWQKRMQSDILKTKISTTVFGRKSLYPFDSTDYKSISAAQRNAINNPIQGSAADIFKIAVGDCYKEIIDNKLENKVKMINLVHDEIDFEVQEDFAEEWGKTAQDIMVRAEERYLKVVPAAVDVTISEVWKK